VRIRTNLFRAPIFLQPFRFPIHLIVKHSRTHPGRRHWQHQGRFPSFSQHKKGNYNKLDKIGITAGTQPAAPIFVKPNPRNLPCAVKLKRRRRVVSSARALRCKSSPERVSQVDFVRLSDDAVGRPFVPAHNATRQVPIIGPPMYEGLLAWRRISQCSAESSASRSPSSRTSACQWRALTPTHPWAPHHRRNMATHCIRYRPCNS
jgi:hypothetical protein